MGFDDYSPNRRKGLSVIVNKFLRENKESYNNLGYENHQIFIEKIINV